MAKQVSFEDIKKLIIECANVTKEITPDSILKEDLSIDSLYAVEMILELEENFDIHIEIEEMEDLIKVSDVVDLVNRKLRG
ncbi:MAG: acyl carrier protein [Acholeplasmatales bacterium]|nr:acyl carrier protein [Acholeplasmatales bacterium]